jgi:hypothetical protein
MCVVVLNARGKCCLRIGFPDSYFGHPQPVPMGVAARRQGFADPGGSVAGRSTSATYSSVCRLSDSAGQAAGRPDAAPLETRADSLTGCVPRAKGAILPSSIVFQDAGVLAKYVQAYARANGLGEGRVRAWISYMITAGMLEARRRREPTARHRQKEECLLNCAYAIGHAPDIPLRCSA